MSNDYPRFHFCADNKEWTVWIEEECSGFSQICFINDEFAQEPCCVIECKFQNHLFTMIEMNKHNVEAFTEQFKSFMVKVLQKVIFQQAGCLANYGLKAYVDEVVPRIYKRMIDYTIDEYIKTLEFPEVRWACKADDEE